MKKLYAFLVIISFHCLSHSQIVSVPDANFKARLLSSSLINSVAKDAGGGNLKIDANNDGEIQESEALRVYELRVKSTNYAVPYKFASLEGINSFTNLTYLECQDNLLTTLSLTLNNLRYLNCGGNGMTSLNIANPGTLETLACSKNLLPALNMSGYTSLQTLYCHENRLTALDLSDCTSLVTLHCQFNQIANLNVSGLTNLTLLYCYYNHLVSFDVSGLSSLQTLWCYYNLLTSINLQGCNALIEMDCKNNELPSLNASNLNTLQRLICTSNSLTSIDLNGCNGLQTVECDFNEFATLNLNNLPGLLTFKCNNNLLTELNINNAPALKNLACYNNQLTSIGLTNCNALERFDCYTNALISLNMNGYSNLFSLNCYDNNLTSLTLEGCSGLVSVNCGANNLSTLDVSDSQPTTIICAYNSLTSLYIKNGRNEPQVNFSNNPGLRYICCDEGQIAVLQSWANTNGNTNCSINSYCSFIPGGDFYTIQGTNWYDSNGNGCGVSDIAYPHLRLNLTDGTNSGSIIPDASGNYSYPVQVGTHTITPVVEIPAYFNIFPATATVTFPDAASPYTQNFCITPNGIHNDLEILVVPVSRLSAGGTAVYKIVYKNKGTHAQNGTVNFAYIYGVLHFASANPSVSAYGADNISWNFTNLQPFESRVIFVSLNVNRPSDTPPVNLGDVFSFVATVNGATDETPIDNTALLHQTVLMAYDPNDKTCLEGAIVSPNRVGDYVHYLIRFENTGTANADNIVVADAIDPAKFDINSLVPLDGSHNFITRINTNKVEFIFENINLPFDDANNDGYVAFKIKIKPTLVVGDTFSNAANIYFDYNLPIVTDPAITTINALDIPDFNFGNIFSLSPVPAKNVLNINKKQEIQIRAVNIYNTLGQVVQVNANPDAVIDVSGLQSGNYILRIITDEGSSTAKFIKE
ncbi:DUF7619 domain-containing protein [Flavobacterium sp.]